MSDLKNVKYPLLNDVVVIRPLIIGLLVILHSLGIYSGAWAPIEGFPDVPAYRWIAKFLQCFRMPVIIFVAGYVYGYQTKILHRTSAFWPFVKKKFVRLMIPAIFFSLIYYFCFLYDPQTFSISSFLMIFVEGAGHMWFLPMIFWSFILMNILVRTRINEMTVLIILAVISPPFSSLPSVIGSLFHNFIYFYLGYVIWRWKDRILFFFSRSYRVLIFFILFFAAFLLTTSLKDSILDYKLSNDIAGMNVTNLSVVSAMNAIAMIMAVLGILVVFVTVNYFLNARQIKPASWVLDANRICYGVYIYHQFLLMYLYYYTPVPQILGPYWLPVVSSIVVLALSVLLARLTLKTKPGRFLMG